MAFGWDDAIFAAVGIWGHLSQQSAQEQALEQQMAFLQRYQAWQEESRGLVKREIGRPSALLKAEHEESLAELARAEQTAMRQGEAEAAGRTGAGGVRWRTRLEAQRARNRENLAYGLAEEERQRGLRGELASASQLGQAGMSMAELLGQKGKIRAAGIEDLMTGVGTIYRYGKEAKSAAGEDDGTGPEDTTKAAASAPRKLTYEELFPDTAMGRYRTAGRTSSLSEPLPEITPDRDAYPLLRGQYRVRRRTPRRGDADHLSLMGL